MAPKIIGKVAELMQRYGAMAFPLRLAVGGFATLVAGTWLGFIAEYAAYRWAIYYGMRPPLEGIPYLKVAITGLSVSILLGGAIIYVVVHVFAIGVLHQVERWIEIIKTYSRLLRELAPSVDTEAAADAMIAGYRKFSVGAVLATSGIVACLAGAGVFIAQHFSTDAHGSFSEVVGVALFAFISMLLLWNRNARIWLALLAVACVTIIVPIALFSVSVYDNILRFLGYGGGLPVVITVVEDPDGSQARTKLNGYLMLRTNSALLLFEPENSRIREVPLQQVLFLDHNAVQLEKRIPRVPQ